MKRRHAIWTRCCEWAGLDPTEDAMARLDHYREWLITEAVAAGGIGPQESDRVDKRHIGDSLLFAGGFHQTPAQILDVGSGVGLPGIPLSIAMPDTGFALLDRSGRRVDLLRRVSRILELSNVEVVHGDVNDWPRPVDGIVSRASLAPEQATISLRRLLTSEGRAVIGGSWAAPPMVTGFDLLEVPSTVLDQRVWLLIMLPQ